MKPPVLLITPPMLQLNAAYPALPQLAGHLQAHGYAVRLADAALALFLRLFSAGGLRAIRAALGKNARRGHPLPALAAFTKNFAAYEATVEPVVRFLQGRAPEWAPRIAARQWLPEGPRFRVLADLQAAGFQFEDIPTRAHHLASLYVDDLADVVRLGVDPRFELSRYAEKLALSLPDYTPMARELERPPTLVDALMEDLAAGLLDRHRPRLVGFTIPFPGNLYAALRMARKMKTLAPRLRVVLGGGYVNTELRQLTDARIFDDVDFITLDDGEDPLRCIVEHLYARRSRACLVRTYYRARGRVVFRDAAPTPPSALAQTARLPVGEGRDMDQRVGLLELPNPVLRLWSDGRWNKLVLAHGCYWHRCAFCDTTLDYIHRYQPEPAGVLVDRMEKTMAQTGLPGFHFVDEAAPPALLKALAGEIIRRGLAVQWWSNIRFEKSFTTALARQLAASGCVAMTGGLETVCDRTLARMQKGITVAQAIRTAGHFAAQGILVHAYLMYGFPSQTPQELSDALEIIRQMYAAGCLHSSFWHRFALSIHSAMAAHPADYGIRLCPMPPATFARNEIAYVDLSGCDLAPYAEGLRKANYNFLHGAGLTQDIRTWFDQAPLPCPRVPRRYVAHILHTPIR